MPVLVDQLEHSTIVCALPSLHRFGAHPRPAPVLPRPFPLPSPTTARSLIPAQRRSTPRGSSTGGGRRSPDGRCRWVQMAATCSEQHAIAYTAEAVRFRSVGVPKATPFFFDPILSDPIRSYPIRSDPILSYLILSDLILSDPIFSDPIGRRCALCYFGRWRAPSALVELATHRRRDIRACAALGRDGAGSGVAAEDKVDGACCRSRRLETCGRSRQSTRHALDHSTVQPLLRRIGGQRALRLRLRVQAELLSEWQAPFKGLAEQTNPRRDKDKVPTTAQTRTRAHTHTQPRRAV